jgi:hypothetical protein
MKNMSIPSKLTIAIVTFHQDFELLQKLVKSIYTYWNPSEIDSIKIVLNDHAFYYEKFNQVVDELYHSDFKIDKIFHYELEPKLKYLDWCSQQMFKCLISEKITTDWYLIHDCKDSYTKNISITDCFTPDGKALMYLNHMRVTTDPLSPNPRTHWGFGPFSHSFDNSCQIFNVDSADCKGNHLPILTPFFVKTTNMKDMVYELRNMMKGMFPFLFNITLDGASFVTEFLLYNAYCYSKNKLEDYADWEHNNRLFANAVTQNLEKRNSDGSRKMDFSA